METIFAFLLQASAGIVLFYLVYWLFLRNETYYNANRWFLILALLSAILVPLFPVHYTVFVESQNTTEPLQTIAETFKNIPVILGTEETATNINWQQAVLIFYVTGAAIFLLRLLTQTFILIHLIIKYQIKSLDGVRIVENEKYGIPFSFFNVIFINPKFHTQDELPEILAHEKVHIRENHWFDLLFIELLTVIFWFNPFIWFFERSIKQNHEYLADKGVLAQGHTLGKYQAILVNQLMGMQIIGITNNLNFALNTNRLKMMTKKKTSAKRLIRFGLTLPALAILLYAFAEPNYQVKDVETTITDITPKETLAKETVKMIGLVLDEEGEPIPGVSVVIKGTNTGRVSDRDGKFELKVPENASIIMSFVGKKTIKDTYAGIITGYKKDDVFNRKYTMKDFISTISNSSYQGDYKTTYNGERLAPPPPPPPPPAKTKSSNPPPPPPKVVEVPMQSKGEKEVFYIVEDMPHFKGGYYAMQDYISKMQQKIAKAKGIKGKSKVLFTVNAKGKVSDIKIVEKDNDDAAKGAILLVSEMPDWTPGKQRGKPVPVKYLLPVEFK